MTVAQLVDNDWNAGWGASARVVRCGKGWRGWGVGAFCRGVSPLCANRETEGRGEERAHPLGTSAPHFIFLSSLFTR